MCIHFITIIAIMLVNIDHHNIIFSIGIFWSRLWHTGDVKWQFIKEKIISSLDSLQLISPIPAYDYCELWFINPLTELWVTYIITLNDLLYHSHKLLYSSFVHYLMHHILLYNCMPIKRFTENSIQHISHIWVVT